MWRKSWLIFSQTVTVAVAALFVVATFRPAWLGDERSVSAIGWPVPTVVQAPSPAVPAVPAVPAAASGVLSAPSSFAVAARRAAPTVVSVTATKLARSPHADDPRFKFFFDRAPEGADTRRQLGLGSAVIVAPEGYLLTNHHVVDGATEIEVQLADGRSTQARLVGSDPETDIAVLKIELENLPVLPLGDVRALQVGDPVLAIGNPFNVGQTVTAGIVSALDRTQAGSQYQNFIQTDAAINPGNSGGALVDGNGYLVGINTAIFSRSGGNLGIGFAVPVDTARQVMEALIAGGKVQRGWIGVEPRELTPELAESLALPTKTGVIITGVLQDGPAAQGGLRPGDVVLSVGDKPVRTTSDLYAAVAALKPGSTATFSVQRGAAQAQAQVRVAERPAAAQQLRQQGR
jgi:Do/DeqQ family serine protease